MIFNIKRVRFINTVTFLGLIIGACNAQSIPILSDPNSGTLSLLVQNSTGLPRVDGLAMDAFGNLFAALETANTNGGVVAVDKQSGAITPIAIGITGADQLAFDSTGILYVTNEFSPAATTGRLFSVDVAYDGANLPTGGSFSSVTTDAGINNPEGLVALPTNGAFGSQDRLFVAEDAAAGRILSVDVNAMAGSGTVIELVDAAAGLQRPEGLAFGDFNGLLAPALYVAETTNNNILRIDEFGNVTVFGTPSDFGLTSPDNVEFGPDGFLYVTEDRDNGDGRVIRIDAEGNHAEFATGFSAPAGLVFDPFNGDFFVSEQNTQSIWKITSAAPVPIPPAIWMFCTAIGLLGSVNRRAA